jgi:hypothetical protein
MLKPITLLLVNQNMLNFSDSKVEKMSTNTNPEVEEVSEVPEDPEEETEE